MCFSANAGREWHPKGQPTEVRVHDFKDDELGVSDGADPRLFDGEDAVFGFAGVRRWPVAVGVSPRAVP